MKNPVFEVTNTAQKLKLKILITSLFPRYTYVKIKKNGMINLGTKILWNCIPIVQQTFHISELCITQLPDKLSQYRQGNTNYTKIYNEYLEYIIHNRRCNIIDFLYSEFLKIKSSSKVDILLEDAQLFLPEPNPGSITIGTIITETKKNTFQSFKLKQTIRFLNEFCPKESIKDQYDRLSFIK